MEGNLVPISIHTLFQCLHWNKHKDGMKTNGLMVTIEKLLDLFYWQIFVC